MRAYNASVVFNRIWSADTTSRAAISRDTGLSRTTVSDIVQELIADGFVVEAGSGESRGGRRPIVLELVADARYLAGVEIGASHIDVVVMNLRGNVRASAGVKHPTPHDAQGSLDHVVRLLEECLAEIGADRNDVLGVGVGVNSALTGPKLRKVSRAMLPDWEGIDLVGAFEDRLSLPVLLDNDANLGALTEYWWGAGAGNDLTYIKLGVGIGSGHILRGDIYRGFSGSAGELGHTYVGDDGSRCRCGLIGCLESSVGSSILVDKYLESTDVPRTVAIEEMVTAARNGDAAAAELVAEAGKKVGLAIAQLLGILNPACVVLSGPLTAAGTIFLDPVRDVATQHAYSSSMEATTIVISEFENLTVAMGGATRVLQKALRQGFDNRVSPAVSPLSEISLTEAPGRVAVR
ncbi:MAG: ROK family transcriptional regulator [Actinomycetota bacterium]|nr:ROK family transcriptional regulator [Actinomycetota bacterium]